MDKVKSERTATTMLSKEEAYKQSIRNKRNKIIKKILEATSDGQTYTLIDPMTPKVILDELKQKGYEITVNHNDNHFRRVDWDM